MEWGEELHLEWCTRPELTQPHGRLTSIEDDLRWKTTFDGRWPSMEDDLRWKTTFDGRRPAMEDDLRWKMTFDRRRPLTEDDLWEGVQYITWKKMLPYLDSHSTTDPKPEILSAVLTGNRIPHDGRNVRGIMHVHVCRKDDIFRQRRLNHSGVGGGNAFRRVYPVRAYSTVVVLVTLMGVRLPVVNCMYNKMVDS